MKQALRKAYFSPSGTRDAVRSVTESALIHLYGTCRLRVRWEARDDMHDAFVYLGAPHAPRPHTPAFLKELLSSPNELLFKMVGSLRDG